MVEVFYILNIEIMNEGGVQSYNICCRSGERNGGYYLRKLLFWNKKV